MESKLKPSYKQTEVGPIPGDWEVKSLGSLVSYRNGKAHEKNITDYGRYVVVNSKFISTEGAIRKYSDDCFCPTSKGDVLMVMSDVPNGRAIAKCYFVESDDTYTANQRICVLSPRDVDGQLLFYKLNRNPFYLAFDDGAKQTNLRKVDVLSCPLAIPESLVEQCAIAKALSDVDQLIGALDKLIAKKRDLKQATVQQLLSGKIRPKEYSEEWETKRLGQLCRSIVDGTHFTPEYVDDGIPFYSVENVTANDFTNTKFISASEHEQLIKRCKPERGDILLTRIGSIGDTKLIDWDVNASIYVSLALVKVSECVDARYLYCYTKSQQFIKDIEDRSLLNASPKKINMGDIASVPIFLPPTRNEQAAIADILMDMDIEIAALEQRRDKTRALKQGMMQELLTGKTRLI
jgi:type I restriction enzyme S subunit